MPAWQGLTGLARRVGSTPSHPGICRNRLLKLADNPPITPVATDGRSIFEGIIPDVSSWVVLYTKPRQEKALAAEMLRLGVDYFLPLVKRMTVSGGRRRTALHPLFPSYLFANMVDEATKFSVQKTNRVVQAITPEKPQRDRFLHELRTIEAAVLACPGRIELQPRVVDGVRVRITGGALKGTEGLVVKSISRTKIWLQVTTLGTGVLVEIDADLLESIE